jgi:hypothetical protein
MARFGLDRTDHDHDDADRPETGYWGDEANNEENYAEDSRGLQIRRNRHMVTAGVAGPMSVGFSLPT